jgi:hypothetical protein
MRRLIGIATVCLLTATAGYAVGVSAQPAVVVAAASEPRVVAGAADLPRPPLADGAPYSVLTSPQGDSAASPAATGPTYYRNYSGVEFTSSDSNLTYTDSGSSVYALAIPFGGHALKRPLELPNGAQITAITLYCIDNDADHNIGLLLYRADPSAGGGQSQLAGLTSTGASASLQTVVSTGTPVATIDNSRYAYSLLWKPTITGENHRLVGVRVEYTVPTAYLPFVSK